MRAPWTAQQVGALNAFQARRDIHPFTCPNDHGELDRTLVAKEHGWTCPHCDYRQTWAHDVMFNPPPVDAGHRSEWLSSRKKR